MKNKCYKYFKDSISFWIIISGIILLYFGSFYFYIDQMLTPRCCDSGHYFQLAKDIKTNGILNFKDSLRSFGYPWFLQFIIQISEFAKIPFVLLLCVFQSTLYLFFAIFAFNRFKQNVKIASVIYLLLCSNIFLLPYFSFTLTDSLYTTVTLFVLMLVSTSTQGIPVLRVEVKLFLLTLLVSWAIVLRPVAVWLFMPMLIYFLNCISHKNLLRLCLAVTCGLLPLFVQILINAYHFDVISFLPVIDLGNSQLIWGIENFKYATWLGTPIQGNFYPTDAFVNTANSNLGLKWYFLNIVDAVKLLFVKFIAAFDWDYLMPYPRTVPQYKWFYSLISFSILYWGLCGCFFHLLKNKLTVLGTRYMPFIILLSWSAVTLASAIELRFVLPMLTYFLIVSVIMLDYLVKYYSRIKLCGMVLGQILFCLIACQVARFVRDQALIQW